MEDIERVLESKIKPLLEDAMQKFLGVTVNEIEADLSDRIKNNPLFEFIITSAFPFKKAKELFKRDYLAKLLRMHFGNVSEVSRIAGMKRESVHRLIKKWRHSAKPFREELQRAQYIKETTVKHLIEQTLETYKSALNPQKLQSFYQNAPILSRDIVKELPAIELTMKQAEQEFEKKYLRQALQENKTITATAKKIGLRYETLHRKLKSLGLSL